MAVGETVGVGGGKGDDGVGALTTEVCAGGGLVKARAGVAVVGESSTRPGVQEVKNMAIRRSKENVGRMRTSLVLRTLECTLNLYFFRQ